MSRRHASFTEADIRRARRAAPECTIEIVVQPDGTVIRMLPGDKVKPEVAKRREGDGYFLYVIRCVEGPVKIGISTDAYRRLRELRNLSLPCLYLNYITRVGSRYVALELEAHTHKSLAIHRIDGEWFDVPSDAAIDAINASAISLGFSVDEMFREEMAT